MNYLGCRFPTSCTKGISGTIWSPFHPWNATTLQLTLKKEEIMNNLGSCFPASCTKGIYVGRSDLPPIHEMPLSLLTLKKKRKSWITWALASWLHVQRAFTWEDLPSLTLKKMRKSWITWAVASWLHVQRAFTRDDLISLPSMTCHYSSAYS